MRLPFYCHFLGVPVHTTDEPEVVAHSRGIWPWKKIVVGPLWHKLNLAEQTAVLLHEFGHVKMFHVEQRIALIPLLWTRWVKNIVSEQEFRCDEYAAACGFGVEMVRVIRRIHGDDAADWHPHPGARIVRLMKVIDRYNHAA